MEKEFAPHQEALEIKELGFDEPCLGLFGEDGSFLYADVFTFREPYTPSEFKEGYDDYVCYTNSSILEELTAAPTYSQAFRWFRDKYKLHSTITSISQESWQWHITKPNESLGKLYDEDFYTYEEAELACLKKLIEIVKNK